MADIIHVRGRRGSAEKGRGEKAGPARRGAPGPGGEGTAAAAPPLPSGGGRGGEGGRGRGKEGAAGAGAAARRLPQRGPGDGRPVPRLASPHPTGPVPSHTAPFPSPGPRRPGLPRRRRAAARGWSRSLQLQWRRAPGCGDVNAESARRTPGKPDRGGGGEEGARSSGACAELSGGLRAGRREVAPPFLARFV